MFQACSIERGYFEPVNEKGYTKFVVMGGEFSMKYDVCRNAPVGKELVVNFNVTFTRDRWGNCARRPISVSKFEDVK